MENMAYQAPQPAFKNQYNRITAAILAIFLGGLGAHKFYLNKTVLGILYIILIPTGLSMAIGVIEGIRYFCLSNEHFDEIMTR